MGYRGKLREQEDARRLRADGKTLQQIAEELDVSKSSVSVWVRDVPFTPSKRRYGPRVRPHPAHDRKLAEIEECNRLGRAQVGHLDDGAFLAAGVALYAGEGAKGEGNVMFANTDTSMIAFFCAWLRHFFEIDESRLRVRVHLHEGLDLSAAQEHWSQVTGVPLGQFRAPHRALADPSRRRNKHQHGCCYVNYACTRTHRRIMGMIRALLSSEAHSGVAQSAEQGPVKPKVVGSSPTPGATLRVPLFVPYVAPDPPA